jgi:acyl-[acyl-carrier-protein]-phospholipid O-acyltransferase/long-chain-fatty-acid--[acyl-carrier-protein] ligase
MISSDSYINQGSPDNRSTLRYARNNKIIQWFAWLFTTFFYRIVVFGKSNIPSKGSVLFISNCTSYFDRLLIISAIKKPTTFLMNEDNCCLKWFNYFRFLKTINIAPISKTSNSIERIRETLMAGHNVCIFPEGEKSQVGSILPFKGYYELITRNLDISIIPIHLNYNTSSNINCKSRQFFAIWFKSWVYPIIVSFGTKLSSSLKACEARKAMIEVEYQNNIHCINRNQILSRIFIKNAKENWSNFCIADSSGKQLTYGKVLIASLLFSKYLKSCDETIVGIILPPSIAAVLINLALSYKGVVTVNLNYSLGQYAIDTAINQTSLKTIITSRYFIEKLPLDIKVNRILFVEDLFDKITKRSFTKIGVALIAKLLPTWIIWMLYGNQNLLPNSMVTIIFSSGSTGDPKGVLLSHYNIIANIKGAFQAFPYLKSDVFLGALPFFHSFGYTGTFWLPLLSGCGIVYHYNPMDAKQIGKLLKQFKVTFLISAPTFFDMYRRQCSKEYFKTLKYAISGAEKLRSVVLDKFKDKFDLTLMEGYGCSEMGPIISLNRPNIIKNHIYQKGYKLGSVGRPLPGILVRIVDINTFYPKGPNMEGLIFIKSPSRMIGYLGHTPLKYDEWYNTGDIGYLDEEGFLFIIDRLSRFSKIGGEMVPHLKIEEEINKILGGLHSMVLSVVLPGAEKENLAVLYTHEILSPNDLTELLIRATTLPKLWLPKQQYIFNVPSLPLLGNGKPNLKQARQMICVICENL